MTAFAETLEQVCVETVESGFMAKDPALLISKDTPCVGHPGLFGQGRRQSANCDEVVFAPAGGANRRPGIVTSRYITAKINDISACTFRLHDFPNLPRGFNLVQEIATFGAEALFNFLVPCVTNLL